MHFLFRILEFKLVKMCGVAEGRVFDVTSH